MEGRSEPRGGWFGAHKSEILLVFLGAAATTAWEWFVAGVGKLASSATLSPWDVVKLLAAIVWAAFVAVLGFQVVREWRFNAKPAARSGHYLSEDGADEKWTAYAKELRAIMLIPYDHMTREGRPGAITKVFSLTLDADNSAHKGWHAYYSWARQFHEYETFRTLTSDLTTPLSRGEFQWIYAEFSLAAAALSSMDERFQDFASTVYGKIPDAVAQDYEWFRRSFADFNKEVWAIIRRLRVEEEIEPLIPPSGGRLESA